ncbi:MAG TPA: MarR family transcriptional regulator [Actinospica sp.]|nr:MarR family transcriptional regulator [Actinospica sp.]
MSSESQDKPGAELNDRLGYLLKHAQQRLAELNAAALGPFGVSGRELAVLLVLDALGPTSQQDAARRLGVDRTTMVALVDALEAKAIVQRAPYARDRRRNVVTFTETGRKTFRAALAASDAAERAFLGAMDEVAAAAFRAQLRDLIGAVDDEG